MEDIIDKFEKGAENALTALKGQLAKVRTGRANVAILDGISVDYYGTPTPLNQVANLSTPEPRVILVQAWEKNLLPDIEKAIIGANIGLTPQNDSKVIRLSIPALTEDRRKELLKQARKMGEECKIAIRNQRRDANEVLKKSEKAKKISEDESKRAQEDVQKHTDDRVKEVDTVISIKEEEIMTV